MSQIPLYAKVKIAPDSKKSKQIEISYWNLRFASINQQCFVFRKQWANFESDKALAANFQSVLWVNMEELAWLK